MFLLALSKAVPPYSLSQMELPLLYKEYMDLSDQELWMFEKIYKNSAISQRFSVLSDEMHIKRHFGPQGISFVGMSERNAVYKKEAPLLAEKAARSALQQWKGALSEYHPCDLRFLHRGDQPGHRIYSGASARVCSLMSHCSGSILLGCFGAFKALKVASKIAKESPNSRIAWFLLSCAPFILNPLKIESIVIQSLFATVRQRWSSAQIQRAGKLLCFIFSMKNPISLKTPWRT